MSKYLDENGLLYLWQKIKNVFATTEAMNGKVDKVTGKGLSTNDYTTAEKNKLASFGSADTYALKTDLDSKVDKVTGKGLSTNDYTTAEKNKLAAFGSADTYALKTDIANMYKYKGSVKTVNVLPSTGQTVGDVYNVELTGMNYAWNGTEWDALGEIFTITSISNGDIDTIVAS